MINGSPTVPPGSYRELLKRGAEIAKAEKKNRVSTAPKKLSKSEKKRRRK